MWFWCVLGGLLVTVAVVVCFCIFFDQAILTRRDTIFRGHLNKNKVLLTFDDGPSPIWTPLILDALKKANIKAVFFMIGHHVQKYPDIARRVLAEGHTIGNHGYAHSVLLYYTLEELEEEVKYTEHVIREITGVTTKVFRPPKAWLRPSEKEKIKQMGYDILLWSLNSKDWVNFNAAAVSKYLSQKARGGDIILFHDSGGVFSREGGDRSETVATIPLLAKQIRGKGLDFVSFEEFMEENRSHV